MITSSMPFLFFYGLIGLLIGSFLNVVIIRVPKEENIAFPSSHCIKCNHPLKWYHNIPVFSWIFLKGKCAFCGEKISIQYPIV
jgi:leader peptidase (prepilin peptidase)/N-methyltransferase